MTTFHAWPSILPRILAAITLMIAVPAIILKLPWLPLVALELIEKATASTGGGTAAYIQYHEERLWRLVVALILYAFGLCAIFGLFGVVFGLCRRPAIQGIIWLIALVVGVALPMFDAPYIGSTAAPFYVFSIIYLPIGIVALSLIALVITWKTRKVGNSGSD